MNDSLVIAIDAGGTKTNIGLVTFGGCIIDNITYPTIKMDAKQWFLILSKHIDLLLSRKPKSINLGAIGIGMRGWIDNNHSIVLSSSIIENCCAFDLAKELSRKYHTAVYMDNDVKAATLAELIFGIGKKTNTFCCINIGTGLAAGFIIDGTLIRGKSNNCGEIGYWVGLRHETCNRFFQIENLVSGFGLGVEALRLKGQYPASFLVGDDRPSGKDIIDNWRSGDLLAGKVVENFISYLAQVVLNIESTLDLGTYVFVGGVMNNEDIMEALKQKILKVNRSLGYEKYRNNVKIEISTLGAQRAGLYGAASVAIYNQKNR